MRRSLCACPPNHSRHAGSDTLPANGAGLWVFQGQANQVVTVDMQDQNSGLDTYLMVYGPDLTVLAENDDFEGMNSHIEPLALPTDGQYLIVARGYGGSAGRYRLELKVLTEAEARPFVVAALLERTRTLAENGQIDEAKIALGKALPIAATVKDPYIHLQVCMLREFEALTQTVESSCAAAFALARPITPGTPGSDTLPANGAGLWVFQGQANQVVTVDMQDQNSGLDTYLMVYGPDLTVLAENSDFEGTNSHIEPLALPADGQYFIVARGYGDSAGRYRLELKVLTETEARPFVVAALMEQARTLAQEGNLDTAVAKFEQALALDPSLEIAPTLQAQLEWGRGLAERGAYTEAITAFAAVQTITLTFAITTALSASDWNGICWEGSLTGAAGAVLPACERGVALAPEVGMIRDSRGLARALTGDAQGAIEDFEFAVQWAKQGNEGEVFIQSRQAWLTALKAGKNPFDATTLEQLRNE